MNIGTIYDRKINTEYSIIADKIIMHTMNELALFMYIINVGMNSIPVLK